MGLSKSATKVDTLPDISALTSLAHLITPIPRFRIRNELSSRIKKMISIWKIPSLDSCANIGWSSLEFPRENQFVEEKKMISNHSELAHSKADC